MILGSSNLTGRYWNGSLWFFEDSDLAPDVQKCNTGHELESGICDAQVIKQAKVLVALDSGTIELLELARDPTVGSSPMFSSLAYSCEHDDTVQSVSVYSCSTKAVSGSWDRNIKVWDLESFTASFTYTDAHSDAISTVACHPKEADIFVSCSQDGSLRLWDTRQARPASQIGEEGIIYIPTAVAWKPDEPNIVAVGDEVGRVLVVDVRQERACIKVVPAHSRRVARVAFANNLPNLVASCADESKVVVTNVSAIMPTVVYEDGSHDDFVRGISWHPVTNKLYSCAFDSNVKCHTISAVAMETNN